MSGTNTGMLTLTLPGTISDHNQTRLIDWVKYGLALNAVDTTVAQDIDRTGHPE